MAVFALAREVPCAAVRYGFAPLGTQRTLIEVETIGGALPAAVFATTASAAAEAASTPCCPPLRSTSCPRASPSG